MTQVLVIAEHANGKLNAATAKCVKAAGSLAGAQIADAKPQRDVVHAESARSGLRRR